MSTHLSLVLRSEMLEIYLHMSSCPSIELIKHREEFTFYLYYISTACIYTDKNHGRSVMTVSLCPEICMWDIKI
jgi:hypothetical protein